MNIYANKGDKVVFAYPNNGRDHDKHMAQKFLVEGDIYTIDRTVVDTWTTTVHLQEVPGETFNSVLFEDVADAPMNPPSKGEWRVSTITGGLAPGKVVFEGRLFGGKLPIVGEQIFLEVAAVDGRRAAYDEEMFRSSKIVSITGNEYTTRNSVYRIEKVS